MTWLKANAPLVLVALCFLLRIALSAGSETYPDEAYYWTWSQHLQLAYFDHPAMIAWSIGLLGIRFGALLWGAAALFGVHRLTLELGGSRDAAGWATALFASTPAAGLLGTFSTPDAPLLAFWVWTLVALARKQPVATGLLWGLAMLSKYNGLLLGLPVLLVFVRRPRQLVLATVIALVVTSPTIIWNATNQWEGFRFQLAHGLGGGGGLATFVEFLGGQFLMAGPVVVLLTIWWLARERAHAMLKLATVIPLVFFGYASWKARGEANWAAASWLSASVGLALTPLAKWKRVAVGLNLVVLALGTGVLVFPPRPLWTSPAVQKLHGWSWLKQVESQQVPVITRRYQLSALASWYGHVPATTHEGRRSQYDLWPQPEIPVGTDAVWIGEWEGPPGELVERFETSTQLDWPLDERQQALHPFLAFRLGKAKPAAVAPGPRPTLLEAIGSTSPP